MGLRHPGMSHPASPSSRNATGAGNIVRVSAGSRIRTCGCALALLAALAESPAKDFTFITLAGPLESPGAVDGPGEAARFYSPSGIAVDPEGRIYVSDTDNHTLRRISREGVVKTLAGLAGVWGIANGTGVAASFNTPAGVAVDGAGNAYLADYNNFTIRKVRPDRSTTTLAGTPGIRGRYDGDREEALFDHPIGIAVDAQGKLYVADTVSHTIRLVTQDGTVDTVAGDTGTLGSSDGEGDGARFNYPCGVALDAAGNLYVADWGNHTIRKMTPDRIVTTLAGTAGSPGDADGVGAAARFKNPRGVTVDAAGNVYVADTGNHTIRKISPQGVVSTLAGQAKDRGSANGSGPGARFDSPNALTVDGAGQVYVADTGNHTIRQISPAGQVTTLAGQPGSPGSADGSALKAKFNQPSGASVGAAGHVYVGDYGNHTVRRILPDGTVTTLAGTAGQRGTNDGVGAAARFDGPSGVAVDPSGNVYVADTWNSTIRKIASDGQVTTLAGQAGTPGDADGSLLAARFNRPSSLALDPAGNLYVADTDNHTIRLITPAGQVRTLAGRAGDSGSEDGTGDQARFYQPFGVAVDASGYVYVADTGNHTIRLITPGGRVTTLAGLAGTPDSVDGTGDVARFNYPNGLTVDRRGRVFVADTFNRTIRRISTAGEVETLAGRPAIGGNVDGTATAARFYSPWGMAADEQDNVYVADSGSHSIRKGSPAALDWPTIDQTSASVYLTRYLSVADATAPTPYWSLLRQAAGSTARLSSSNAPNPTFAPDLADLYVFRLSATNAAGEIAIRTVPLQATNATVWLSVRRAQPESQVKLTLHGLAGRPCELLVSKSITKSRTNWATLLTVTNFTGKTNVFLDLKTNNQFFLLRQYP